MTAEQRFVEALEPLRAYCEEHGYRWRWKTAPSGQHWQATVQIIDPSKAEHRDRVRAWIESTAHAELAALDNAITWSINAATERHQIDANFGIGDGLGAISLTANRRP